MVAYISLLVNGRLVVFSIEKESRQSVGGLEQFLDYPCGNKKQETLKSSSLFGECRLALRFDRLNEPLHGVIILTRRETLHAAADIHHGRRGLLDGL